MVCWFTFWVLARCCGGAERADLVPVYHLGCSQLLDFCGSEAVALLHTMSADAVVGGKP